MSNAKVAAKIQRQRDQLDESSLTADTKRAMHKLLDDASDATNGCPDKLQALTELMADQCIMRVEDRITLADTMKTVVSDALTGHSLLCPVMRATLTINGKQVYPWDDVKAQLEDEIEAVVKAVKPRTFFTFAWGDKKVDAGGWAAPVMSLVILIFAIFYLRSTREEDIKSAVHALVSPEALSSNNE